MTIKLYGTDTNCPVRAVLLTMKAIGLKYEMVEINLMNADHLKPEFLKINPQHTIPTLDDDGFYIWDSHVIASYLVSKYAKNDDLYPKDLKKRAVVDRLLHFDSGIIFPRLRNIFYPMFFDNGKTISQEKINAVYEAYDFLEIFLKGNEWLAGNQLTIADLCIVPSISSLEPFVPIGPAKYPRLTAWMKKCQELPYYQEGNQAGRDKLVSIVKGLMSA